MCLIMLMLIILWQPLKHTGNTSETSVTRPEEPKWEALRLCGKLG